MPKSLALLIPMLFLLACAPQTVPVADPASPPVHGVWLTNVDSDVLFSKNAIQEAVDFLADHGFNTIYVVMWNDAHTLFPSQVSQKYLGYSIDPRLEGRDPLQEIIDAAHARGLRIIPWFEYGFAASYKKGGGVILQKYPHWAARDTSGVLLTKNGFEWLNGYHPEVQTFISEIILEVVRKYEVDGIQGDDRLPAQPVEGGYSEYTQQRYADDHQGVAPPDDPRSAEFKRWRADILNAFGEKLYTDIKAIKPELCVSWAPSVYPWSYDEYLQDWPNWIKGGYADEIIPQNYRYEIERYISTMESLSADSLGLSKEQHALITPGILMNVGKYLIPEDYLEGAIIGNRKLGYNGEVFFFYEGLVKEDHKLAKLISDTFYKPPSH